MIAIVMFAVIVSVLAYVLNATLLSWSSSEARTGIDISLDRGIEEVVRDLRESKTVQSSNDEIRFTQDAVTYYIYYLYNASDSYPSAFNQTTYQLRKTTLVGGIGGTFTYGSGPIIITDVIPPPTSDLSFGSNVVTLDLSVLRRSETIRSRSRVKPRNL